jgi:hypothetical protein
MRPILSEVTIFEDMLRDIKIRQENSVVALTQELKANHVEIDKMLA